MNSPLDKLFEKIYLLEIEVNSLKVENAQLREENARLKERLNLNSKNSSKPPSSDQKGSSNFRKKNGAKPGHPGHFWPLFTDDQIHKKVSLKIETCPLCGASVRTTKALPSIHQQVEIPKVCFHVTQYESHQFYCSCCQMYGRAPLPSGVGFSAFGTRLTAFVSFLSGACRLSKRMVLQVLKEGLGIKVAVGSISNIEQRVSLALKVPYEEIEKEARTSRDTKYIDETGWRKWGQTEYLWVMGTKKVVLYKIQENRNAACRDVLLGEARLSKAAFVTDRLALYRFETAHQYCLAHLKRDLKRFSERSGLDGEWGKVMLDNLDKIFGFWKDIRENRRSRRSFQHCSKRYRDEFVYGLIVAAKKSRHSRDLRRFAKKLLFDFRKLFVFAEIGGVEPTNNQAERDLRGAVIWRKICHGTKSDRGNRFVERIYSVIGTLSRQKQSCLEFLSKSVDAAKRGLQPPLFLEKSF